MTIYNTDYIKYVLSFEPSTDYDATNLGVHQIYIQGTTSSGIANTCTSIYYLTITNDLCTTPGHSLTFTATPSVLTSLDYIISQDIGEKCLFTFTINITPATCTFTT
jgi:hypothetical protein